MTTFHVISLFPESFESYINASIVGRAQKEEYVAVKYYNPRDYATPSKDKSELTYAERRVDDRPYGGGPGMVIEAMPIVRAIEDAITSIRKEAPRSKNQASNKSKIKNSKLEKQKKPKIKIVFFSPSGKQFTNSLAETYKKYADIILVCGRYEGIDARVKKIFPMVDISVGPYVLTGGELPAMILIDSITRRISGVLGDELSIEESRLADSDVYTRPEVIKYKEKKYRVPKILLSGHRAKIDEWKSKKKRYKRSLYKTRLSNCQY